MKYTNYFAEFANVYGKVYDDIVAMMQESNTNRLELPQDEDYSDNLCVRDSFYMVEKRIIPCFCELVDGELYVEDDEEYAYSVRESVEGAEIILLYDLVYNTLYGEN